MRRRSAPRPILSAKSDISIQICLPELQLRDQILEMVHAGLGRAQECLAPTSRDRRGTGRAGTRQYSDRARARRSECFVEINLICHFSTVNLRQSYRLPSIGDIPSPQKKSCLEPSAESQYLTTERDDMVRNVVIWNPWTRKPLFTQRACPGASL